MKVTITHSGTRNIVKVWASQPNIATLVPRQPIKVELQLFRDGKNGKSAFEIAQEKGYPGTENDFVNDLVEQDIDFNAYYILSKN